MYHPFNHRCWRWMLLAVVALAAAGCPSQDGYRVVTDVRYAETPGVDAARQSLDIYLPDPVPATAMPVVIWIHGGGWRIGDKSYHMSYKAPLFTAEGYCLVGVNYRLSPSPPSDDPARVMYPVHEQDVAAAIAWVYNHIAEYGGDPQRIALLGHSAGAHLVSIVATDESFLQAHDLPLTVVKGVIPLDTEGYDVAATMTSFPNEIYRNAFGEDPLVWAAASPINHVVAGKGIPSFLLASRGKEFRRGMCADFAAALTGAGVNAAIADASAYNHMEVNRNFGMPGETIITPPVMAFLNECFGQ